MVVSDNLHLLFQVGGHDRIGMQFVPLKQLTPHEMKEFKLDLLKDTNITDSHSKKQRGQLVVELTFVPFKEDTIKYSGNFSGPIEAYRRNESEIDMSMSSDDSTQGGSGVLSVMIQGAEDVEGKCHNNPYALILFKGEKKKTHVSLGFNKYKLFATVKLWFLSSNFIVDAIRQQYKSPKLC